MSVKISIYSTIKKVFCTLFSVIGNLNTYIKHAAIFHILFPSYVPQRHSINPYPPSLRQKDECPTIKYLVTEMPADILGKLIRHFAPG